MKQYIEERAINIANYIIQTNSTIRDTAQIYKVGKSTVHKDVSERLKEIDVKLYQEVKNVLENNLSECHIRGGIATKRKYNK